MAGKKLKPLLPSLRENKRYLAFEVVSDKPIKDIKAVSSAIIRKSHEIIGLINSAEAGIMFLGEKYDTKKQKGILKVNNKYLSHLKASLSMITEIDKQKVLVRSLGASGMINKADELVKN